MIRLLAAMLAIVGLLSMAPAVHAGGSAMGSATVACSRTSSVMASGSQASCINGNLCMLVCAACFPASAGQAGVNVLAGSKINSGTGRFASFDLSWRLYRPPKAG